MTGKLSKNFHGVGIGPLSNILAVKVYFQTKTNFLDNFPPNGSLCITRQPQEIRLGGEECFYERTIVHEFIHAIGFTHEQNRPDRDDYIDVMYDNIKENHTSAFEKKENDWIHDTPYDWKSVMHYAPINTFGISDSLPTMKSKVC